MKIQKKWGGGGWVGVVGVGRGVGGPFGVWCGGGGSCMVWGRWVMWGLGDVN